MENQWNVKSIFASVMVKENAKTLSTEDRRKGKQKAVREISRIRLEENQRQAKTRATANNIFINC